MHSSDKQKRLSLFKMFTDKHFKQEMFHDKHFFFKKPGFWPFFGILEGEQCFTTNIYSKFCCVCLPININSARFTGEYMVNLGISIWVS
jgi:hypothetical protein